MHATDSAPGPRGHFVLHVWKAGRVIETLDEPNLVVDASKLPLSRLVGGTVANNSITKFGVGTSGTAPAAGNTTLTGSYSKSVDSVSYPSTNQVAFAFSLGSAEANGLAILEFGLLTAGNTLFARKVRTAALNKDTDISFTGTWTLTF